MKDFRTYQLAKRLFHLIEQKHWPTGTIEDQAYRASLSVALNLAEGSGKRTLTDRRRFYHIAMGSLREVQACLDLDGDEALAKEADVLGAHLYKLIRSPGPFP